MKILKYIFGMLFHPRRTSLELVKEKTIWQGMVFVGVFSLLFAILFLIGYLKKLYPPDAATLGLWVKTWGAFAMLPVLPIPIEKYRLFIAIILVPLGLLLWLAAAGIMKLFSVLFKGMLAFKQYLNIVAFGFFPYWLLAFLTDTVYSSTFGANKNAALMGELGSFMKGFVTWFPQLMYPFWFGLGAIALGVAMHVTEKFPWWKCAIAAFFAFMPILAAVALLLR